MLERGDRLVGRVHRDQRGDGEPIAVRLVLLGHELVVQAADGDALLLVVDLQQRDPHRRVQHREVDAGLAEALVVPLRRRHRGVVLGGRRHVPRVGEDAAFTALLHREIFDRPVTLQHALEQPTVPVVPDVVEEHRHELDDVTVAVEHRVSELLADAS